MSEIVKIITRLDADAAPLFEKLDKVNEKYGENQEKARKLKQEIAELTRFEQGLAEQRAKTNNPTIVAQFNQKIDDTKNKIAALNKELVTENKLLKETGEEATKLKKGLGDAFDGTKPKSLKAQLRELKAQLASTDDDEEFLKLSIEAGRLEDKIGDAAKAAQIFASDSKFEIMGNAIGNVGQKLLALDFEGAVQGSQLLVRASQQITFKEAIQGIKQIGTTLFNVGKALLTNPLFLIGTIAAVVISNFSAISEAITGTEKRVKELTRAYEDQHRAQQAVINQQQRELELAEAQGRSDAKLLALKKQVILAKIEDAKAGIIFNNAKQKEVNENDNLTESYYRISASVYNFIGAQKLAALFENGLSAEKRERNKEASEEQFKQEQELLNLINQLKVDAATFDKKIVEEAKERKTKLRDLEIANITDETERAKAEATAKYNDEFIKAKGNKALIAELRIQLDREIAKIDKDAAEKQKALLDKKLDDAQAAVDKEVAFELEKKKKQQAIQVERLDEEQRHQTAMLEIRLAGSEDAQIKLLANELAFERARLQQIAEFHGTQSDEYVNQANKIIELEEKLVAELGKIDKKRLKQVVQDIADITKAVIDGAQKVIAAEITKTDKLISLQQKRVDEVAKIAENGNAELLELEKERLDKLNKEKEKFVRQQQALATIELVANTAVTVSKAAAEGGAGAAITIAAALVALIAGLASARSIAGQAAFYEGGYTGDGNPREVSTALGARPYVYHKGEFVHDHENTRKFRSIFEDVHAGKIDLNQMKYESEMYRLLSATGINTSRDNYMRGTTGGMMDIESLKQGMKDVEKAVNRSQSKFKLVIDKNGIGIMATNFAKEKNRINTIAR